MPRLMFLANHRLMLWLRSPGARQADPGETAALIRSGGWPLPAWVGARFELPASLRLDVRRHGTVVVVRADPPLRERHPSPSLTPDQVAVLRGMARGLTADQIALALSRRRRWVCYQMAEVRRKLGVTTRAAALKKRGR